MSAPVVGPSVVAIGGGHGLSVTLSALRGYAGDIYGIVSVADDGGSSGRLRKVLGTIPPGDLRKCLVALADEESHLAQLFDHRFHAGELAGHALGNLILAALFERYGDLQLALDEAGKLLGTCGRVVPAALQPVVLIAETANGEVKGQSAVMAAGSILHLTMLPPDPAVPAEALSAICHADQVIIGPGSLYTSIIAAAGIPAIAKEISATQGQRIYVTNLREQSGETDGYDVAAHVLALHEHGIEVDLVLADPGWLPLGALDCLDIPVVLEDIAREGMPLHDPYKLAAVLSRLHGHP
ncbi:MAG: uridine diphosphate-N-acetylglucosamine-binding protein YvcK [Actinobacteria bacterium]|nr:uridine diphosphate-N-acetylglucosamine-binding protein YvcK [Actinomycetota bacterium]